MIEKIKNEISESIDVELIRGGGPMNVSALNNNMLNA